MHFIKTDLGKLALQMVITLFAATAFAAPAPLPPSGPVGSPTSRQLESDWERFETFSKNKTRNDYLNGLSYIISGSLAYVGGQFGQSASNDQIEKGVFSVFQTIGIASIGYGAYTWKVGGDDRLLYETLQEAPGLDERDRAAIVRSYFSSRREREKRERLVKAITHGIIAAHSLYTATQQTNESIKNAFFFIGGVNVLATISYSF